MTVKLKNLVNLVIYTFYPPHQLYPTLPYFPAVEYLKICLTFTLALRSINFQIEPAIFKFHINIPLPKLQLYTLEGFHVDDLKNVELLLTPAPASPENVQPLTIHTNRIGIKV